MTSKFAKSACAVVGLFVLQDKSGLAVIAASHEKDEEDHMRRSCIHKIDQMSKDPEKTKK